MEATNPEMAAEAVKATPKKRGRKSKRAQDRNMRRMIENKLEDMRLKRFMADYCFDE